MLNVWILDDPCISSMDQMVDHTAVEYHHEDEWGTVVQAQIDVIPQWINAIRWGIRTDRATGPIVAGKDKEVEIE